MPNPDLSQGLRPQPHEAKCQSGFPDFAFLCFFFEWFCEGGQIAVVIFLCADCRLFSVTTISFIVCNTDFSMYHVTMRNISDLHHGLVVGATSQSCSSWVFCALWPWPFPSHLACLHPSLSGTHHTLKVLMLQGLLYFSIVTEVEKESAR